MCPYDSRQIYYLFNELNDIQVPVKVRLVLYCVAVFRAAAEAQDGDILKMYNIRGSLMVISPSLPANTPDTRYRLQVAVANTSGSITSTTFACLDFYLIMISSGCW